MEYARPASTLDPARLRRLRWRSRRGLLENDLVLTRFLAACGDGLTEDEVLGLDVLLDLPDNDLLDLILGRRELTGETSTAATRRVLDMLRSA